MGLADREYYRSEPRGVSPIAAMRMWSITTWLIAINVAVFILNGMFRRVVTVTDGVQTWRQDAGGLLEIWGHFSVATAIFHGQIWRFITFQFLHAGLWHLLLNMLGLFFFGPLIERYLGTKRFLAFYLLCGIAGPIGYMILWAASNTTGVELLMSAAYWLVGASAGVFGILIAAAHLAPNATVLVYGIIPMRMRVLALALLGIAVYHIFVTGQNAGGEAAHLAGAAAGFLLIRNPRWLNFAEMRLPRSRGRNLDYKRWRD
jgi:membrane associated rhomboid family serine protease